MKFLYKAKKLAVGTIRSWKGGRYIKDRPGHWKMLAEIVNQKLSSDGVHPNDKTAHTMHVAARQLVRHIKSDKSGRYSKETAKKFIDKKFGHLEYKKFGLWRKRVVESVEKYLKSMMATKEGSNIKSPVKSFTQVKEWRKKMDDAFSEIKDQEGQDNWIIQQFSSKGKKIAHLLVTSRKIIGKDVPLSTVGDGGFKGLCKAIIQKAYDQGPSGWDTANAKVFERAFKTFFKKVKSGKMKPVPLEKALSLINKNKFFEQNPKWFVYCCTRQAMKNDGMVNMLGIENHMKNAMRVHKGKNPPRPDYDMPNGTTRAALNLGLITPAKVIKKMREKKIPQKNRKFSVKKRRLV